MKAHFGLPSVTGDLNEGKPPINVKFEIPYFTTSGIQVRTVSIGWERLYRCLSCPGEVPEDHREVWLPGPTMGEVHHSEWRLPAEDSMIQGQKGG